MVVIKMNPSHPIVLFSVINLLVVYYGHPPSMIDAVSATIVDGGQAICQQLK
jgi:hypothetical protein